MESQKRPEDVNTLKKQLELIRNNFIDLLNNRNESFLKGAKLIDTESDKRVKIIEEGKENELAAAEMVYKSQVESIETDFEKETSDVQKQIFKILQYKMDSLGNEFPLARDEILKHETPLKEHITKTMKATKKPILKFEESSECLLDKNEITEDTAFVNSSDGQYQISNGILTQGKKTYRTGSNCSVYIGEEGPFTGSIGEIKNGYFQFVADGFSPIELSLQGLNMGLSRIV